jgi:hypothetical protein
LDQQFGIIRPTGQHLQPQKVSIIKANRLLQSMPTSQRHQGQQVKSLGKQVSIISSNKSASPGPAGQHHKGDMQVDIVWAKSHNH